VEDNPNELSPRLLDKMMHKEEAIETYRAQDIHNTPVFGLSGWCGWARLVDVYDGDTITVIIKHFYTMYKIPVRLNGIDTPEMNSTNVVIRQQALKARNELVRHLTCNNVMLDVQHVYTRAQIQTMLIRNVYLVWVCFGNNDKYGRVLADVYTNDQCDQEDHASQVLISKKLGFAYKGGKKLTEDAQIEMMTTTS
jgi:endonuclease YncB( thermonuclease family)